MPQTFHHRLHILEAADWKAGVITLLAPSSPYRPWRYAFGEARPGDYALLVLGTDPQSVLTVLARVDDEGTLSGALLGMSRYCADLFELATLASTLDLGDEAFTGWRLDDDAAERAILAVHETRVHGDPYHRYGHSSLAAARNLLRFNGRCQMCDTAIDLTAPDARDQIHVHTAEHSRRPDPHPPIRTLDDGGRRLTGLPHLRDAATDWPVVTCRDCHDGMRRGGFSSSIDYAFARHPQCPRCGGQRSRQIVYGMPNDPQSWEPWIAIGGCCLRDDKWTCELCRHEW